MFQYKYMAIQSSNVLQSDFNCKTYWKIRNTAEELKKNDMGSSITIAGQKQDFFYLIQSILRQKETKHPTINEKYVLRNSKVYVPSA